MEKSNKDTNNDQAIHYKVLQMSDSGCLESTYFRHHHYALAYAEKHKDTAKSIVVYKVINRDRLHLGAVNVFGGWGNQYQLEQAFKASPHNYKFSVI